MVSIQKAERLLEYFFELDEEDQSLVMARAIELQMKHNAKHQLEIEASKTNSSKKHINPQFSEEEINRRAIEHYNLSSNFVDDICSKPPDVQAATILFLYRLGICENMLERTEIKVTVTQRSETIQEMLEELFPDIEYEHIHQTYKRLFAGFLEDAKKQFAELKKSETQSTLSI